MTRRARARARLLARIGVLGLLAAPGAHAYCRTTTQAPAPSFQPAGDSCWTNGIPVWWKDSCVAYGIEATGGKNLPYDAVAAVAAAAFATWTSVSCPAGALVMAASAGGPVPAACTAVGYVKGAKNNVSEIVFQDERWPYSDGVNTIALTTVTFNSDTGQILDSDIELNTSGGALVAGTPGPGTFDLQSVLTHEAGHFFGLAHSGHAEATMYSMYKPQSTSMRVLAADDVSGICALYGATSRPTARGPVSSECLSPPRGTFDGNCPAPSSGGCDAAGSAPGGALPLAVVLALGLARARHKRRLEGGRLPSGEAGRGED